MADMNDRLRNLGDFEVDPRAPVASLEARARQRKRGKLGLTGVVCVAIVAVGALALSGGSSTDDVSTTGEGSVATTEQQGTVLLPSLLGTTVMDATGSAESLGLRIEVEEGDADLAGAIVIAQEPPAGQPVPHRSVIGLRTALPDTTAAQECPGTSHPHERPEGADSLPSVEQVERSAVVAVQNPASATEGRRLVLGLWNRYAYRLDESGEPTIEQTDGFQLMAIYDTIDDCPEVVPAFTGGAPLTRVVLDRTDLRTPGGDGPDPEASDGGWSTVTAPPIDLRSTMTVEWTGSEVLVVGGIDLREGSGPDGRVDGTNVDGDGTETPIHEARSSGAAAFDPATGDWRRLPDLPFVPNSVAATAWTGSELLMFVHEEVASEVNGPVTEARILHLDPLADGWRVVDAPDRADGFHARLASAFTGDEWLLWGYPYHQPESEPLSIAYEPGSSDWRDIARGPLGFRELPGSVWTGEELVVFGGDADQSYDISDPPAGEGAAYDPVTDSWRELPPSPAPDLRGPSVLWTGSEVLVWGGSFGPSNPTVGAAYDPSTNSWRTLAPSPLYGRNGAIVVWDGREMVVADGTPTYSTTSGGAGVASYDPIADTWRAIPDPPGGSACNSAGVATPFGIFVFGGSVDCTSITTPRESVLRLDPPR